MQLLKLRHAHEFPSPDVAPARHEPRGTASIHVGLAAAPPTSPLARRDNVGKAEETTQGLEHTPQQPQEGGIQAEEVPWEEEEEEEEEEDRFAAQSEPLAARQGWKEWGSCWKVLPVSLPHDV